MNEKTPVHGLPKPEFLDLIVNDNDNVQTGISNPWLVHRWGHPNHRDEMSLMV